jgi:hypothetical protein
MQAETELLLNDAANFVNGVLLSIPEESRRGIAATLANNGAIELIVRIAAAGEMLRLELVDASGIRFEIGALVPLDTYSAPVN